MKDWDDLQTVLALGRAGTMKGAAQALGVSETTISRRIQKISRGDVALLFTRDGQRWLPSKLGVQLIGFAETVEKQMFEADAVFDTRRSGLTGELRVSSISFINTYFIGPRMIEFQREHPDLTISLEASDDRVSLAYREADVALRLARPSEGRLIGKRVARIPISAVARRGVKPKRWVGLSESLDWTPEMQLGKRFYSMTPFFRSDSFDGILQILATSDCGGIAPLCVLNSRKTDVVPLGAPIDRELWLTYHEDLRNSAKVRAVIDWLAELIPNANRCLCGSCES